jgi:Protein of unknown function (DUF2817)
MPGTRRISLWFALLAVALLAACTAAVEPPPKPFDPDPAQWFPADYGDSRTRFRADCEKAKTGPLDFCRSWKMRSKSDKDLTIDYAFFSGGGDRLLVVHSGIHGSEAASGAAVQAMVMRNYLPALRAKGIDVVFIHSLNPYGFKYDRRTDEFNVNLNRNFTTNGKLYKTTNDDYSRYRTIFEPTGPVKNVSIASIREGLMFFQGVADNGFKSGPLNNGMNNGQYQFPRGLNYGGKHPQEQTRFLRQAIGPILAKPYRKVLILDYHTGLGDDGVLSVILGIKPAAGPLAELKGMLAGQEKNGIVIETSDSPGFFATSGDVIDFMPSLARNPDRALAVTMEYGTMGTDALSELKSAARMILENQAYYYGCATPGDCRQVDADFRELFNPREAAWRSKILREADRVFQILRDQF